MTNWSPQDLSQALGVQIDYLAYANEIQFDSRELQKGDIFIALKGEYNDGHSYVDQALAQGASYVVVSESFAGAQQRNSQFIVVPDPYQALLQLARYNRARSKAKYIGITGSIGKTSLKELLKTALSKICVTYASRRSFNNHLGVPITLASVSQTAEVAIIEMGLNHPNELTHLSQLVRPDLAIITSIAAAHMEFFTDLYMVAKAKLEILDGLAPQGTMLLPRDNTYYDFLVQYAATKTNNIYSFGTHLGADSRILDYRISNNVAALKVNVLGTIVEFTTQLTGKHQASNLSTVLLIIGLLKLNYQLVLSSLATAKPVSGRGNYIYLTKFGKKLHIINDTYNANPESMKASLVYFADRAAQRKVLILADMLELGSGSSKYHSNLAPLVEQSGAKVVLTLGSLMKNLYDALPQHIISKHYNSITDLQIALPDILQDQDWLLLKGSNTMKLSQIVKYLQE